MVAQVTMTARSGPVTSIAPAGGFSKGLARHRSFGFAYRNLDTTQAITSNADEQATIAGPEGRSIFTDA